MLHACLKKNVICSQFPLSSGDNFYHGIFFATCMQLIPPCLVVSFAELAYKKKKIAKE
jgi:hypothetical protein